MSNVFTYNSRYSGDVTLKLFWANYVDNDNLAVLAYDASTGERYATISVNIEPLLGNVIAADMNNCPDLIIQLVDEGVLSPLDGDLDDCKTLCSGYCEYPLCEVDMSMVEKLPE